MNMHIIVLFATILLGISWTSAHELPFDLITTFDWLDGGSYTGVGTYQRRYTFPVYSQTFRANAEIYVSYNRGIISIQTEGNALGSEWIDRYGHWYYWNNGRCYLNPDDTYLDFLADYRELVNVDRVYVCDVNHTSRCGKQNLYAGSRSTNCGTHACAGIRTNPQNNVIRSSYEQILFEPEYGVVTKRSDDMRVTTFIPGEPDVRYLERPCECDTPLSFCDTWYPPCYDYHLCL